MNELKVWCDGACFPNPGQGGWAWTTLQGQQRSGGLSKTTNQVMELIAAIEAVKTLKTPGQVLIVISDSQYVVKGMNEWMKGWIREGWTNSKGYPVANLALWKELKLITDNSLVKFQWVKGHSGDAGNDAADNLATLASGASEELIQSCSRRWK